MVRQGSQKGPKSAAGNGPFQQSQTIQSPERTKGLFGVSASPYRSSNTGSKRTSDLYNVDVARAGYQELDPLIPHQSSIINKPRQNDSIPSSYMASFQNSLLPGKSPPIAKSAQDGKRFGQSNFNLMHRTIDSDVEEPDSDRSNGVSLNATANFFGQSKLIQSSDHRQLSANTKQVQPSQFLNQQPIGGTFATISPQKNANATSPLRNSSNPENKSLSPLTGNARYPKLLPMQTSVQSRLHHHRGSHAASSQAPNVHGFDDQTTQKEYSSQHATEKEETKTAPKPQQPQTAAQLKSQAAEEKKSKNKQHQYYVDISDIIAVLTGAAKILESTSLDSLGSSASQAQGRSSPLLDSEYSTAILEVAGGDYEAAAMLKLVEEKSGLTIQQFLQTFHADYRAYQTEDSSLITSIFFDSTKALICNSLLAMKDKIDAYIKQQFKGKQGTARIGLSIEKELYNIFRNIFGAEIFGQTLSHNSPDATAEVNYRNMPRRIMGELWQAIQIFRLVPLVNNQTQSQSVLQKQIGKVYTTYPASMMTAYIACKLLLHCRGKALFCSKHKTFTLHKAVFEGNLPLISRLVSCKQDGTLFVDKNEIDPCGNSPLVLAIRLKNIDIVKILTDLYCSAKLNSFPQVLSAMDIAKTMKDRKIVEVLMNSLQKVKQHYLEVHKDAIFQVLERLPDFSIDLHFECTSNYIPLMKHFTPSDVYHIYKQGSNLRLDMRFLGYKKLKAIESNISVLFKGRNSQENEGELLLVDHESGRVASIFENATNAKIERDLDNIMSDQDIQKKYRAEKIKIEPECDRKGQVITQKIDEFIVQKYAVNSVYTMTKFKLNLKHVEMLTKYRSFEDYVKHMKIDIFALNNPAYSSFSDARTNKNSFALRDEHAEATVSSRPQVFAATTQVNQLLQDIKGGQDQSMVLHTQGDVGMDNTKRRDSSVNDCQMHRGSKKGKNALFGKDPQLSGTSRPNNCSCDQRAGDNSNFGLTPIITKSNRRTLNATIWLCQDHPLSIETFLPLLQVLSFSSKQIRKLEQAIDRYNLPKDRFPLKARVPVFMLVEATFQFQNLQFGQQPNSVFQIDQQVLLRQREKLQQHYQLMQDHSKRSLNLQTEDEILRQNQTLSALYRQLSIPASNESNSRESSISNGIEDRYKRMLSEQDQGEQEESKTQIILKNENDNDQKMVHEQGAASENNDTIRSSGERHTPANEYDIAIDSASNRGANATLRSNNFQLPTVMSSVHLDQDQQNAKTTRKISQVKTMSQINERHEKHTVTGQNGLSNYGGQQQETYEQLSRRQEKLDENQQLIERLTGKPLSTQEQRRHSHHKSNMESKLTFTDQLSLQTVQERKKRRKELIRLYKLRKTEKLDKGKSRTVADMSLRQIADNSSSENIMDSRVVEKRPDVNQTVEKRKLVEYNESSIASKPSFKNLKLAETSQDDTEAANAGLGSKRSSRVAKPPYSVIKKEAGSSVGSQKGKLGITRQAAQSTADESSGHSGDSKNQKSLSSLTRGGSKKNLLMSDFVSQSIGQTTQSFVASLFSRSVAKSQVNDQTQQPRNANLQYKNQLQTIESEEVQGTDGTVMTPDKRVLPPPEISQNPYYSNQTLKSLESALAKGKGHSMQVSRQLSRQTQDIVNDQNPDQPQSMGNQGGPSLSQILRPAAGQQISLTSEERETLTNPNLTLNRLHQYVVNNQDIIKSQVHLPNAEIMARKKQRGHTSYVSQAKYQDAGMISFEALLGSSISGNQKRTSSKQTKAAMNNSTNLAVIKEEKNNRGVEAFKQAKQEVKSPNTPLQVLLAQKQHQASLSSNQQRPGDPQQRMAPVSRKAAADVDIRL